VTTPTTLANDTIHARCQGSHGLFASTLLAGVLAGLLAAPTAHAVCGDVTGDEIVNTGDALRVLRESVQLPTTLVCTDQCAALEERLAKLETLLAHVTIVGDNLVLTGMNFQVVSGSGDTDGDTNGTGNIVIGYDESDDNNDQKDGSHNLIIGRFHSYEGYGGIVAGEDNEVTGASSSILGGTRNEVSGDGSVIVSGRESRVEADTSVIVAGENNVTKGRSCVITAGALNLCTGLAGLVDGGTANFCSGNGSVIGGGSNRTLGSNNAWMAGSLGPVF
jgi:hypothetical protein